MTLIKTNFMEKECWEVHCKYKVWLIHFLDCFNIGKEAQKTILGFFFFFSAFPMNGVFGTYGVLVASVTQKSQMLHFTTTKFYILHWRVAVIFFELKADLLPLSNLNEKFRQFPIFSN